MPSRRILRAALISRSITRAQSGQRWTRSESGFGTRPPQPEQLCELPPGGTATTWIPASSALYLRSLKNSAHPWSLMSGQKSTRQPSNLEILHRDQNELRDQPSAQLMSMIPAKVSDPLVQARQ